MFNFTPFICVHLFINEVYFLYNAIGLIFLMYEWNIVFPSFFIDTWNNARYNNFILDYFFQSFYATFGIVIWAWTALFAFDSNDSFCQKFDILLTYFFIPTKYLWIVCILSLV